MSADIVSAGVDGPNDIPEYEPFAESCMVKLIVPYERAFEAARINLLLAARGMYGDFHARPNRSEEIVTYTGEVRLRSRHLHADVMSLLENQFQPTDICSTPLSGQVE